MSSRSIFDCKPTLDWIEGNMPNFLGLLNRISNAKISPYVQKIEFNSIGWWPDGETMEHFIKQCLSLFPENALRRGHCKRIDLIPQTYYFGKDSTAAAPKITDKLEEADSPYSMPFGYSTYLNYNNEDSKKTNVYEMKIELYKWPECIPAPVKAVYLAYVVAHEFGHTLQMPAYYWKNYAEYFLGKKEPFQLSYSLLNSVHGKWNPRILQEDILTLLKAQAPLTQYSKIYKLAEKSLCNHEYMADAIAAYVLQVTINPQSSDQWRGLDNRQSVKLLLGIFLESVADIEYAKK